jgi:LysR family glycine cleavage system transcriptional activator
MLASFLQKWLLPRLPDLKAKHPDLDLRIHTARENVDFSRSDFHAALRLGQGSWKGLHAEKIMEEWLVVVASPELLAKHGSLEGPKVPEDLPMLRGTELEGSSEPWIHWLEVGGKDPRPVRGSVLDDSVSVITAAEQGLGYAPCAGASQRRPRRAARSRAETAPYRWAYYFVCPKTISRCPRSRH